MRIEKIETEFIINDGYPSPKIISDSYILKLMMKMMIQLL